VARVISMGSCHRAFALTAAMCLAVAARIEGTVVHACASEATPHPSRTTHDVSPAGGPRSNDVRLGHPSGILPIDAAVRVRDGAPWAERVTAYRTARRLMEGFVRVP
jgi:2-methylaconitate cis-trans-isomerase PrpF